MRRAPLACGLVSLSMALPACAPADEAQRAWACEPMRALAPDQESRVVVELDTREAIPGSYVQSLCGARAGAPEALVRYVVPSRAGGSGYTALTIELATRDGVDWAGAAVVRACPPPSDAALECLFATGELTTLTHPGDTLDVIVTSNGAWDVEAGEVELAFSPRAVEPPRLDEVRVLVDPEGVEVRVRGDDADGDAHELEVLWLDAAGVGLPPEEGAFAAGAPLEMRLLPPIAGRRVDGLARARAVAPAAAVEAWVWLVDALGLRSERQRVAVERVARAPLGGPCDELEVLCDTELECRGGRCEATLERRVACESAMPLPLEVPSMGRRGTPTRFEGVLRDQPRFSGSCGGDLHGEALFAIDVPAAAGRVDLVLDAGIAPVRYLAAHVRQSCADARTERWCIAGSSTASLGRPSRFEVRDATAGRATLFVEIDGDFSPPTDAHELELVLWLRPVVSVGSACDPMELENRCAGAPCSAGVCP